MALTLIACLHSRTANRATIVRFPDVAGRLRRQHPHARSSTMHAKWHRGAGIPAARRSTPSRKSEGATMPGPLVRVPQEPVRVRVPRHADHRITFRARRRKAHDDHPRASGQLSARLTPTGNYVIGATDATRRSRQTCPSTARSVARSSSAAAGRPRPRARIHDHDVRHDARRRLLS